MSASSTSTAVPPASAARILDIVKWVLPLGLTAIAVFFEWNEHIAREHEAITPSFLGEIFLFAMIGPVAVFITLAWVTRLLRGYARTSDELATVNRDLEEKFTERTQHLEETTAQLAAANTELAAANADLRQLDRLKSEFVSLVSHQLRAPLTNIRGALEIVGGDADLLPPPSRRTLEILTLESERLSGLIMTILDVSRIEAGRLAPRLGLVAIEPLLARACSATLGTDGSRPWTLTVDDGLPPAWTDEMLVEEIARNLLDNADDYSAQESPVDVVATLEHDSIRISVTDHGPGVPPEEQDLIFESFHRVGDEDTTVRGYGLGLYFADRLVRAMGGAIEVESPVHADPSQPGSRFIVTLPVADDTTTGIDDAAEDD